MGLWVDHGETHLNGSMARLTLIHGFTQTGRCWGRFKALLGSHFDVATVDAPGHGNSGHAHVDLSEAARLIIDAGGPGHYIGYSMGARMLLHAAIEPAIARHISSLVLIGATAGIDDQDSRALRREQDEQQARWILSNGVTAFVDRWLAGSMFVDLEESTAYRSERLKNTAEGLASSLRNCGTGTQEPLWSRLRQVQIPVLVIAGREDPKFTALARRLVSAIGAHATFAAVAGRHAVHLSNPSGCFDATMGWFRSQDLGGVS